MWCGRHSLGSFQQAYCETEAESVCAHVCVCVCVSVFLHCVCMLMFLIKGVGDHPLAPSSSNCLMQI